MPGGSGAVPKTASYACQCRVHPGARMGKGLELQSATDTRGNACLGQAYLAYKERDKGTPSPCNSPDAKLQWGRTTQLCWTEGVNGQRRRGGPAVPEATALRRPARESLRRQRGVGKQARDVVLRGAERAAAAARGGQVRRLLKTCIFPPTLGSRSCVALSGTNSRVTHTQAA